VRRAAGAGGRRFADRAPRHAAPAGARGLPRHAGQGRHGRAGALAQERPGHPAVRHRDAAHGRLRPGAQRAGRSAPGRAAGGDDHLAHRAEAPRLRGRTGRAALPGQALFGRRTAGSWWRAFHRRAGGLGTGSLRRRTCGAPCSGCAAARRAGRLARSPRRGGSRDRGCLPHPASLRGPGATSPRRRPFARADGRSDGPKPARRFHRTGRCGPGTGQCGAGAQHGIATGLAVPAPTQEPGGDDGPVGRGLAPATRARHRRRAPGAGRQTQCAAGRLADATA
jgi:hypothetical protein